MALRTRWWLPAATAAAAVLLGTVTPLASAAGEPAANSGASFVYEDGSYPNSDQVFAETGARLVRGDGGITYTSCSGPYQIKIWARGIKLDEERMCFAAPRGTGFLTVNIPGAYRIQTYERSVKASISVKDEQKILDFPANTGKGFGEAGAEQTEAVLLEMRVTGTTATTPPGVSADPFGLGFNGKLTIGDSKRTCSAALVDPEWVISAKSCFADNPAEANTVAAAAPKDKTTVVLGKPHTALAGGHTSDIAQLVPHPDRDLIMARLAKPTTNITPVPLVSGAPVTGQQLTVVGFGRTKTEWIPTSRHDAKFAAGTVEAAGFDLAAADPADATVCMGDGGGPALRRTGVNTYSLAGIVSRSFQGGCLGSSETRTGAYASRVDDLGGWIAQARSLTPGWKTETLVQAGTGLYQGIRLADGSWTGFTDVQAQATNIGGVRTAAAAGINADTHVVALGGNGKIYHTVRKADGTWGNFGHVGDVAGTLSNVTQVSAVSVGNDLHVVAVASGKVFHSLRNATGNWTSFGDVAGAVGPIGTVTAAATASVGGELQLITVSGGKAYHTIRNSAGQWSTWGNVAGAAGTTGPITSVSMAGTGGDAQIVIATDNGTRQYHAIRKADRTWTTFGDLKDYLGTVTVKSLGAAHVDGELQLTATTTDNKLLHIIRHADRTWTSTTTVSLQGVTGTLGTTAITGTL
ncbi:MULTISPECIES: trypsin-like serine protease [unclassified Streptomyces]|uniref:trypsin-like serine protease n=1 Tax=unclassified Streptomyces TaxID=2593676 RepID=UPI0035DA127D